MELNNVKLYRITHLENIPHILKHGITHKDSQNKNPGYKNIGDLSLINTRSHKHVIVDNGEFNSETEFISIKLGDYIPFYFGVRMPMLYVAQHGGNFVESSTSPENIVYLACPLCQVISCGEFYFSDGHATDMLTSFYDKTKITELVNIIDWMAVQSSYWGGTDNLNIKRKKQAEFLIRSDLTPDLITGFGCYNEHAKNRLISFGVAVEKIRIIPQAYF